MSQNPLISVIIPVYNGEKYLRECVDSALGQTYTNLDVILVDDGSSDGSPQICDDYAERDSRVRVIHKPNGGLSDARNAGLDIMQGEYLFFIDGDDWIAQDTIEVLYNNMAENGTDISCCGYYRAFVGLNMPFTKRNPKEPFVMKNEEAATLVLENKLSFAVHQKLYKRHIFDTIRFPAGKWPEDAWIIIDLFMAAKKISYDPAPRYYYRCRKSSYTRTDTDKMTRIKATLEMVDARHAKIMKDYPNLISLSEAYTYRRYILAANIMSDNDLQKTSAGHELLLSVIAGIKENRKNIQKNSNLGRREKLLLRALAVNQRLYRMTRFVVYIRFKRKRKGDNKPKQVKMLFD